MPWPRLENDRRRETAEGFPEYEEADAWFRQSRIQEEIAVVSYVPRSPETDTYIALETFVYMPMSTQIPRLATFGVATTTTGGFVTP